MSDVQVDAIDADSTAIPFKHPWTSGTRRYRLKSKIGETIDNSIDDTYKRVARAVANVEKIENEEGARGFGLGLAGVVPYRPGRIVECRRRAHKPATSRLTAPFFPEL
jgi:ribonucleoside-diphosphate reductase alpha chain